MAAPKYWRNKRILFALEGTYGSDAAPTGGANAVLAMDVSLKPMEGQDQDRDLEQPGMGANGTIPTDLHSKITFSVDLSASGVAGTAPAWGALLRACGVAETISVGTSVEYTPISDSFESGTFHIVIDKTRYVLLGSRGTAELDLSAQATPKIKFDFTGLFAIPTEVSAPAVVLSNWKEPKIVSAQNTPTFTIDATPFVMKSAKLALGNKVEPRFLVNSDRVLITDKSESFETTVEAQPLTAFDPFTMALNMEKVAVDLVHGTVAGSIATLSLPTAQMQRPSIGQSQDIKEWPLRLIPRADSENDQWSLTLT